MVTAGLAELDVAEGPVTCTIRGRIKVADETYKYEGFLTLQSPVVTICTTRFTIQQFYVLPARYIYVLCVDMRTNSDYFTIQH